MGTHSSDAGDTARRLSDAYRRNRRTVVYPVAFFLLFVSAWTAVVELLDLPLYILPSPLDVVASFQGNVGTLLEHARVTFVEAAFGWVVGNVVGLVLGIVMAESDDLRRAMYPYLVGFRSIPVIAFAPLLIVWFGVNATPIYATATITVFFPTLVNAIAGFRATDQLTLELMHTLDANRWEVLRYVRVYDAMPYIFSSLKITVALSLIGAVVGEWLVADSGLGFLVVVANNRVDMLLMFRAIIFLGLIGVTWFATLALLERHFLGWSRTNREGANRLP